MEGRGSRAQLRDDAVSYVRELIASGQVRPNDLLRIQPIAQTLEMSATPVREALLLLAKEGWVTQEPNVGFKISQLRRRDVEDAYLVHAFAAGELTARAARRINRIIVARLRELDRAIQDLCDAEVADETDRSRRVEDLNYALHGTIYETAASPRLWWFLDAASHFGPRRFWITIPGWVDLNRTGHTAVIDALERKDVEVSRHAMSAHIEHAAEVLLAHLDSLGFWRADAPEEPAAPEPLSFVRESRANRRGSRVEAG